MPPGRQQVVAQPAQLRLRAPAVQQRVAAAGVAVDLQGDEARVAAGRVDDHAPRAGRQQALHVAPQGGVEPAHALVVGRGKRGQRRMVGAPEEHGFDVGVGIGVQHLFLAAGQVDARQDEALAPAVGEQIGAAPVFGGADQVHKVVVGPPMLEFGPARFTLAQRMERESLLAHLAHLRQLAALPVHQGAHGVARVALDQGLAPAGQMDAVQVEPGLVAPVVADDDVAAAVFQRASQMRARAGMRREIAQHGAFGERVDRVHMPVLVAALVALDDQVAAVGRPADVTAAFEHHALGRPGPVQRAHQQHRARAAHRAPDEVAAVGGNAVTAVVVDVGEENPCRHQRRQLPLRVGAGERRVRGRRGRAPGQQRGGREGKARPEASHTEPFLATRVRMS